MVDISRVASLGILCNGNGFFCVRTVCNISVVIRQVHIKAVESERIRRAFILMFDQTKSIAEFQISRRQCAFSLPLLGWVIVIQLIGDDGAIHHATHGMGLLVMGKFFIGDVDTTVPAVVGTQEIISAGLLT